MKRKCLIVALAALFLATQASAQINLGGLLRKVLNTGLSEKDASQGVREALTQGIEAAVANLHKTDGFFGNAAYKIMLPPEAQKAERGLRQIGLGSQVDRAVLAINRGAEDAVGSATPIFVDAIKQMTLTDALGIVRGTKNAATRYFKQKTSQQLLAAFTPPVRASLEKVSATRYYDDVATLYNRLPTTSEKINPDLTAYVAGKAVDALFDQIAREEANIRTDPKARTTEVLKKVFGSK